MSDLASSASWVAALDARQRAMLVELGLDELDLPRPPSVAAHPSTRARVPTVTAAAASAPARVAAKPMIEAAPHRPGVVSDSARSNASVVATMDWAALKAEVSNCRACGLCESRSRTVFGVGASRPDILIVGEAPGQDEDRLGEPFVGRAGALLDLMLGSVGLSRHRNASAEVGSLPLGEAPQVPLGLRHNPPARSIYIANTLKCRPPGNRNPSPAELAQCTPLLARQIELLAPKLIVASGRFAIDALLQTPEPVGKLRGRIHDYRGIPVVVTYHPSYLLRTPAEKAKAWDDWCLVVSVVDSLK